MVPPDQNRRLPGTRRGEILRWQRVRAVALFAGLIPLAGPTSASAQMPAVVEPDTTPYALAAYYIDAESFEWDGKVLRLSNGSWLEGGVMYDASGERHSGGRPLQVFTR